MRKKILAISITLASITANSQVIIDTVSTGTSYANQVWYSLENDDQGSAPKNNWDLAFDVSGQGSTILINSITGTTLWNYPNADTIGWNTIDTSGINTWMKRWNSDTSWAMGAIGKYASINNSNDIDWGIYSSITHIVTGDSVYIIKLASGAYKKLHIQSLNGGVYSFRYADLNGANLQNATLIKSNYTNKNFGYYSLQTNTALSREPVSANWDLLFSQYTAFIPTPYTVTGITQNKGVKIAKIKPIANANTYNNWMSHSYKTAINQIGYDWKVFTSSFIIEDSLVYFLKAKNGNIWKVIPTGFGGSATGNYIFSKEKLSGVGVNENNGNTIATIALYPNPSNGKEVSILLTSNEKTKAPIISIYDLNGKLIKENKIENVPTHEVNLFTLNTDGMENGIYVVNIKIGNASANQKLILNNK